MRRRLLSSLGKRKSDVDMIVLHSVAMSLDDAVEQFKKFRVSCHYMIDEDGSIWQLTSQTKVAWHAGISKWRGMEDINSRSIGIEICSSSLGQDPFSLEQQKSVFKLLRYLVKRYKIKPENIVGHSDIAPMRKADPGKAFFWKGLADEGIGLWYDISDAAKVSEDDVAKLLQIIGYDIKDVMASAYAFCRRFYPEKVVSVSDVWKIEKNVYEKDESILEDNRFREILKSVAYAYCKASSTPCNM